MKRRLTKVVGSVILSGVILSAGSHSASAQDSSDKQARRDAKREAKMERDYAKLDRWLERQDLKRAKEQNRQEERFGKFAARNTTVSFSSPGQTQVVGYFDQFNKFRRAQQ
jgi:hypothetical protein